MSEVEAPYVSETIRRFMIQQYGLNAYTEGYEVYTSIDSSMQKAANLSIAKGLQEYDRRHGFRKPENLKDLFPEDFILMNYFLFRQNVFCYHRFLSRHGQNSIAIFYFR